MHTRELHLARLAQDALAMNGALVHDALRPASDLAAQLPALSVAVDAVGVELLGGGGSASLAATLRVDSGIYDGLAIGTIIRLAATACPLARPHTDMQHMLVGADSVNIEGAAAHEIEKMDAFSVDGTTFVVLQLAPCLMV